MKVMIVLGTRPEAIKLAPVINAFRANFNVTVCSTGQHREMLSQALEALNITLDVKLDTMSSGRSLNILASRQLEALDNVLEEYEPDWVIVQGDTTTAFCAGLAAFQRGIKVGHIEAGLRTGSLQSPFPEEANRSLLGRIANLHFAPTAHAARNLEAEGISRNLIRVTGNTLVDTIKQVRAGWVDGVPQSLSETILHIGEAQSPLVLVTCHRRENFGSVLSGICQMLARLCESYPHHRWVFPVHLNPNVREPVMRTLGNVPNLHLIDPVDYQTSLYLISKADLIVSDSGGIQEEAPSFGAPVVVMRQHTERMEGVEAGFATLAGQDPNLIEDAVRLWLDNPDRKKQLAGRPNPYGDGLAAKRIMAALSGAPVDEFNR